MNAPSPLGRTPPPLCKDGSSFLSVVVPAYNEEERLLPTLETLRTWMDSSEVRGEILVVNDGSRDGTCAVVRAAADSDPRIRALGYASNRGKGWAVRTGVLAALGDEILFTDADLSTPIDEYRLLRTRLTEGWDIAIGSRHLAASRIEIRQPLHRRYLGRVFNGIIALLGVRGFADTQCGFKLFRRDAARRIFSRLKTVGFAFDVEVLLRAREAGLRVAEVPVRWANSSSSRVRPVYDSCRMLMEILRMRGIL